MRSSSFIPWRFETEEREYTLVRKMIQEAEMARIWEYMAKIRERSVLFRR